MKVKNLKLKNYEKIVQKRIKVSVTMEVSFSGDVADNDVEKFVGMECDGGGTCLSTGRRDLTFYFDTPKKIGKLMGLLGELRERGFKIPVRQLKDVDDDD